MTTDTDTAPSLRGPTSADAAGVHALVEASGVLDVNSVYAYLLVCTDFARTSVVADRDGEVVGFVAGYCPPGRDDVVFVWQVGVAASARRQGLGQKLLDALLEQPGCESVRWLETTITPSNLASQKLFASFARRQEAGLEKGPGFSAAELGSAGHEEEERYRIGPLEKRKQ
ncbi:MAG: diaminobutyrate acetyltransferase [Planctomycetota bacterium]